ncbi:chorismate--pyruvate lyase family protein [Halomonas halocynthiae]|uniref:chorismate--pyruvate lyase family protein n=1 Tax=Halomonas halocynthiae TaxID=176290 RepID=UPI001F0A7FED|nr:chorismate lyase [Halomonas halocynthiae]
MVSKGLTQARTIKWQPLAAARPAISHSWWQWVSSTDSLTTRLTEAGAPATFRVRLLSQRLGRPSRDEALALDQPIGRWAWIREVALCLNDQPWVIARSVAPLDRLNGHRLDGLGERSLGSWLFSQPGLKRGAIEITRSPAPFHQIPGPLGRRSILHHQRFTVLVQEFFLDNMADNLGLLPSR